MEIKVASMARLGSRAGHAVLTYLLSLHACHVLEIEVSIITRSSVIDSLARLFCRRSRHARPSKCYAVAHQPGHTSHR